MMVGHGGVDLQTRMRDVKHESSIQLGAAVLIATIWSRVRAQVEPGAKQSVQSMCSRCNVADWSSSKGVFSLALGQHGGCVHTQ